MGCCCFCYFASNAQTDGREQQKTPLPVSTRSDFSALSAAVIELSQAEHEETKHLFVLEGVSPGGNHKKVLPVLQVTSSSAARHLRHHRLSVAKPPLHFLFFRGVQHLRIEAPADPIIGYQYIITALSGNRIPDWLNNFATLWLQHPSKTSGFEPPPKMRSQLPEPAASRSASVYVNVSFPFANTVFVRER